MEQIDKYKMKTSLRVHPNSSFSQKFALIFLNPCVFFHQKFCYNFHFSLLCNIFFFFATFYTVDYQLIIKAQKKIEKKVEKNLLD